MSKVDEIFNAAAKAKIKKAIQEAERNTSGEIRVHVERKLKEDLMDHAAFIFEKLEMHRTAQRNGVLFYLAFDDHKFAILGDAGINSKVHSGFWDRTRDEMAKRFKSGDLPGGLAHGVLRAGEELKRFFPYQSDDENELSDDISMG